jgi:secondary thiamine-phosphate synthase enzyme
VQGLLSKTDIKEGTAVISVVGSTASVTTCEYESGVIQDLKDALDRIIPQKNGYHHDAAWGDGNAHSHMRASILGPSLVIPFQDKTLLLGTWQQVIFIDFDNQPRQRKVIVQFQGE